MDVVERKYNMRTMKEDCLAFSSLNFIALACENAKWGDFE